MGGQAASKMATKQPERDSRRPTNVPRWQKEGRRSEASGGVLGPPWGTSWHLLGGSWEHRWAGNSTCWFGLPLMGLFGGCLWPLLGDSWPVLGLSWTVLWCSRGPLGLSWGGLGGSLGCLACREGRKCVCPKNVCFPKGMWQFWRLGALMGVLWGASRGVLGGLWGPLGHLCAGNSACSFGLPLLGHFGGRLWALLGDSWAVLGLSWAVLWCSWGQSLAQASPGASELATLGLTRQPHPVRYLSHSSNDCHCTKLSGRLTLPPGQVQVINY